MKKLIKLFLILVIAIALSMNFFVLAAEEPVTTNNDNSSASELEEVSEETSITPISGTVTHNANNTAETKVSSTTNTDGGLSISDILNILLIATGVVIILLAIAIFIKLK